MSHAGWLGLLIIIVTTMVAAFTAKQLVWTFNSVNERKRQHPATIGKGFVANYDQLAEELAGPAGSVVMKVITIVETFGFAVALVVLHSVSWPRILHLPDTVAGLPSKVLVCGVMCLVAFPFMLLRVRHLSRFSPVGLIATVTLCLASVAAPLSALEAGELTDLCEPLDGTVLDLHKSHSLLQPGGIGVALGLVLFAFGGHAVFPEIYATMPAAERCAPTRLES